MKFSFKPVHALAAVTLSTVLLAGCGANDPGNGPDAANQTLTVGIAIDVGDLNPHTYAARMFAQDMVYDGLLTYQNGEITPALAESWEESADGTQITFTLRKGVKFSDGTEFTSANVVRNFDAIMANKDRHAWLGLIKHMTGYSAPDESTFVVTLDEPYYPAVQEFTHIRPLRVLGDAGFPEGDDTSESIATPVGTGMWMLEDYVEGEQVTFVRNDNYWGDKPKLAKVILRVIPNTDTAVSSLEAGEVDMILDTRQSSSMTGDQFTYLQENGFGTVVSEPMMSRIVVYNTQHGALQDLRVRQAMNHGVDRQLLATSVYGDLEPLAESLFPASMPYCDITYRTTWTYDVDKAKALLDEAGWKLPEGSSVREKDGQKLSLTFYYNGADVAFATMGQILQSAYARIGIELNLQGEEEKATIDRWRSGDFDLVIISSWGLPYDPHSTLGILRQDAGLFYNARLGIDNYQEVIDKFESILTETDEQARAQEYAEILNTLQDEAFYLPLSGITNRAAFREGVEGVEFNIAFDLPLQNVTAS